jgi:hypothetical protein
LHIQRDPKEIATKLDQLLNDRELHARLRQAGIATAEKYEWKKIAQQYLSLFDDLIAERAQSQGTPTGQHRWSGASRSLTAPNPSI